MMKTFDLKALAKSAGGEYVLGVRDTGTHACYLIYGTVWPGDPPRMIKPGAGHEEIIMAVEGEFGVSGHFAGRIKEGEAFHMAGEAECFLVNVTDKPAVYIASGGHSETGGHGHNHHG